VSSGEEEGRAEAKGEGSVTVALDCRSEDPGVVVIGRLGAQEMDRGDKKGNMPAIS